MTIYSQALHEAGSEFERTLAFHLRVSGITGWVQEYRFTPERMWRFDFWFPDLKLGVEVEGGSWNGGRHTRGSGFEQDCIKYNAAVMRGYFVLRFTSDMVKDGRAIDMIKRAVKMLANR